MPSAEPLVPVPRLSPPPASIGDPISNGGFEFSISFMHLVRQSAVLKSHFVKSKVIGPPSRRSSDWELSRRIVQNIHQAHCSVGRAFTAAAATTAFRGLRYFWMLPSPLGLSLLFDGFIGHFGLLFPTPFCKRRWFRWRWRWRRRRRQRRTAATATATPLPPGGARGCPPSPSGRCLLR